MKQNKRKLEVLNSRLESFQHKLAHATVPSAAISYKESIKRIMREISRLEGVR